MPYVADSGKVLAGEVGGGENRDKNECQQRGADEKRGRRT